MIQRPDLRTKVPLGNMQYEHLYDVMVCRGVRTKKVKLVTHDEAMTIIGRSRFGEPTEVQYSGIRKIPEEFMPF